MDTLSLAQLSERNDWNKAVIVFTEDSFDENFNETERSYQVTRNNHYFDPSKNSKALFGDCLDGKDNSVRLDIYMALLENEGKRWNVESCYIVE